MSYLEQAKQNKANAEKAAAFDNMQVQQREQQLYNFGRTDGNNEAYAAVEEEIFRKLQAQQNTPSFHDGLAGTMSKELI